MSKKGKAKATCQVIACCNRSSCFLVLLAIIIIWQPLMVFVLVHALTPSRPSPPTHTASRHIYQRRGRKEVVAAGTRPAAQTTRLEGRRVAAGARRQEAKPAARLSFHLRASKCQSTARRTLSILTPLPLHKWKFWQARFWLRKQDRKQAGSKHHPRQRPPSSSTPAAAAAATASTTHYPNSHSTPSPTTITHHSQDKHGAAGLHGRRPLRRQRAKCSRQGPPRRCLWHPRPLQPPA